MEPPPPTELDPSDPAVVLLIGVVVALEVHGVQIESIHLAPEFRPKPR